MQFYDKVSIIAQSGRGGDGAATGRREKCVPFGGPSGGDGGKGGSIFLRASPHEYTLLPFRFKHVFKGTPGQPGRSKDQFGADAEDMILNVPLGTRVTDTDTGGFIASLDTAGDTICIAHGGRGGAGNRHFVNANHQYSSIALYGEPGQKKNITLELQLIADVALVGEPSVGKSSLINFVSNVKAKTAEYHFTTLVPNLGVVDHRGSSFTMIDIPGLIEDAHQGKGLGNEFLRHVLKASCFVFMLDISLYERGMNVFGKLLREIELYTIHIFEEQISEGEIQTELLRDDGVLVYVVLHARDGELERKLLMKKFFLIGVNKIDLVQDQEIRDEYLQTLSQNIQEIVKGNYQLEVSQDEILNVIFSFSAATGHGVEKLMNKLVELMKTIPKEETVPKLIRQEDIHEQSIEDITKEMKDILVEEGYVPQSLPETAKIREITSPKIAYLTYILPRGNDEAELRYRNTLEKEGHLRRYEVHGVKKGDILRIISPYAHQDQRFILRD